MSLTDPNPQLYTGLPRSWVQNAQYDAGSRLTTLDTLYGGASCQSYMYLNADGSCCDVEYYYVRTHTAVRRGS